jgi:hypothetical protein
MHTRSVGGALALGLLLIFAAPAGAGETADSARPAVLPPPAVRAWQTGALAPDKLQHFSLAFSLGLGLGIATREPAAAAGGAIGLALAKELSDRRRSRFDRGDLLAGIVGAGCAALAVAALQR